MTTIASVTTPHFERDQSVFGKVLTALFALFANKTVAHTTASWSEAPQIGL
jgi:hypothetical protein